MSSRSQSRRDGAVESYRRCASDLGQLGPGSSIFALTHGQWSLVDAVLHAIDCCSGPVDLSIWTWAIGEYDAEVMGRLMRDGRIRSAILVIDVGMRADPKKSAARGHNNSTIMDGWTAHFGPQSVRHLITHAKMATVTDGTLKFLLRGSMNLNFNPHFENFDLTEGGPEFDLIAGIEAGLPCIPPEFSTVAARRQARVNSCHGDALQPGESEEMWA
jgi:hypothetical protein